MNEITKPESADAQQSVTVRQDSISAERLRDLLIYEPETGAFRWRRACGSGNHVRDAGSVAGCQNRGGYWQIALDGRTYYGHRLAWLYVRGEWPPHQVDHRDMNRANNAIRNLRLATNAQNKRNSRPHADNSSGFKGVYLHKTGLWHATIMTGGIRHSLGYFHTPKAAHAAYAVAAAECHGEFARTA